MTIENRTNYVDDDGMLREFPPTIRQKYDLARAMHAAARRLATEAFEEADQIVSAVEIIDPEDPFQNVTPRLERFYGDILELGEAFSLCKVSEPGSMAPMSPAEIAVRDFVRGQTIDNRGDV